MQRLRFVNKYITNRILIKFAGSSHSPITIIRHVGRRSGKYYQTPIIAERIGDDFVFALTYGPGVDWYRNVLAAGQATVVWHGREWDLASPVPVDVLTALPAFPQPLRFMLRMLSTRDFFRMKVQEVQDQIAATHDSR